MSRRYTLYHSLSPRGSSAAPVEGESLTQQAFKDDSDINILIEKATGGSGYLGTLKCTPRPPKYGDYSQPTDFAEMHQCVSAGIEYFASLSARERAAFGNSPALFFEWINDPKNRQEALEYGFLELDDYDDSSSQKPSAPESSPTPPVEES